MSKSIRGVLIGLVAVFAFLGFASMASALTVSPSGGYTATSRNTSLTFTSNGQTLTCALSVIRATISSNGSGTIAAPSGAAYSTCTNPLLGTFTVQQPLNWTLSVVLRNITTRDGRAGILVGLAVTVPARGAQITGPGGRCVFTVSGRVEIGKEYVGATLPITTNVADVFNVLSSSLTTDSTNGGCSPLLTVVGLGATYAGGYTLDKAATVSG